MSTTHAQPLAAPTVSQLLLVLLTAFVALLVLYLIGFDQGALSRQGMLLHEVTHDGRHLLGMPCH